MSDHWKIKPVAAATLPVPGWECVFGRNDCAMRDLVFWIWILRKGDQVGLIDAGCPQGIDLEALNTANATLDPRSVFTIHRTLTDALAQEGISPEAVDFVLISQLITYATGGLNARNLPRAKVYCAWEGMKEFLTESPGHPPREFYLTSESWAYFRDLLLEDRIVFAQESIEPAEGIVFEPTGGHHPGSAGVRIHTRAGVIGVLETAFVQENIDLGVPIGIAEDAARCRQVIQAYKRKCALVLAGHEPAVPALLENFNNSSTP